MDCGVEIPCKGSGGRMKICESCLPNHRRDYIRKWKKSLSEEDKQRMRDEQTIRMKEYRKHHTEHVFDITIQRRYGITLEYFFTLYNRQDGKCAICKTQLPSLYSPGKERRKMMIDHDHNTNTVRGILCFRCNSGIGLFDDNPDVLLQASKYLSAP